MAARKLYCEVGQGVLMSEVYLEYAKAVAKQVKVVVFVWFHDFVLRDCCLRKGEKHPNAVVALFGDVFAALSFLHYVVTTCFTVLAFMYSCPRLV